MNLPELAQAVATALQPALASGNAPQRASHTNAILTAFRPYVEAAVTGAAPKQLRDQSDRREKMWLVSLAFWTGTPGTIDELVAESDGRVADGNGKPSRYGGDQVKGLDGAAELVAEYAMACGAPPDFDAATMRKALAYLRPTISRQQGHATMRRTSACGRWHLVADIFREGSFPAA